VFEAVRQERDQAAALRQHVFAGAAAGVDAQRATVIGTPSLIQVESRGNRADIGAGQLVEVTRISGARRIQREVTLEILEARHEATVQRHAQVFQQPEQPLLRIELGLGQPRDEIAAHFRGVPLLGSAADARGPQRAADVQRAAAGAQVFEQVGIDEVIEDAEATRRELVDQAR
jgi:hypothetical protein